MHDAAQQRSVYVFIHLRFAIQNIDPDARVDISQPRSGPVRVSHLLSMCENLDADEIRQTVTATHTLAQSLHCYKIPCTQRQPTSMLSNMASPKDLSRAPAPAPKAAANLFHAQGPPPLPHLEVTQHLHHHWVLEDVLNLWVSHGPVE